MKNSFTFILSLFFLFTATLKASCVSEYKSVSYCIEYDTQKYKVIRSFKQNGQDKILVVDSDTLHTYIFDDQPFKKVKCSNSRYEQLLQSSSSFPYPLTNDGITHFKYGLYLTVDFCPSSKCGYERGFFKSLIKNLPNPVPVTLFMTKRWIKRHKSAFCELKRWANEGKLDITWGNHTAYHFYKKGLPISQNFVLCRHIHLKSDVLELEKYLIQNGVTPSVFFRFPGLVSNKKAVKEVSSLSLIMIGSDSWIAKCQQPKDGSIVLVHGNKNEHLGIYMFLQYLHKYNHDELFSLRNGVL